MKSSASESKPFHSRSRGEIPGRARRKERLSRSKLKQAFLIDSVAELLNRASECPGVEWWRNMSLLSLKWKWKESDIHNKLNELTKCLFACQSPGVKNSSNMGTTTSSCHVEETVASHYDHAAVLEEKIDGSASLRLHRITSYRFEAILYNPQYSPNCFSLYRLADEVEARKKFK